ncbi:MAG TPA: mechanosensitive ion channel family protein [Spirochaetales bacterium]|nr:mechanosensitive ion channel family protein [Spirochaetales bacterium]
MQATTTLAEAAPEVASAPSRFWEIIPLDNAIFEQLFTVDTAITVARVVLTAALGFIFVGLVITVLRKVVTKRMEARSGGLVVKIAQYLGFAFIAISVLDAAGVNLSALLGAAGIAGIAIGFAAQTSVSNFISGFFIVSEKTFSQGDVIDVDGTSGLVHSIDAMSVKLRTFDNRLIRIPNETLIKSNVKTITRFPIRRLNMDILVTYDTDIERARQVLLELAAAEPNALRSPEPVFMVSGFRDSGIALFFGVWFATNEWFDGNNAMHIAVKKRFDEEGIRFALPTRTVYQGKAVAAPKKPGARRAAAGGPRGNNGS